MTLTLAAFNFFERELKNINFAMRSPFKVLGRRKYKYYTT